jgi:hypothetical protein
MVSLLSQSGNISVTVPKPVPTLTGQIVGLTVKDFDTDTVIVQLPPTGGSVTIKQGGQHIKVDILYRISGGQSAYTQAIGIVDDETALSGNGCRSGCTLYAGSKKRKGSGLSTPLLADGSTTYGHWIDFPVISSCTLRFELYGDWSSFTPMDMW